ncbi:hypothetical protein [Methylocella silvestris]|uniref:AAA+ ATPase domain-containing protein n=1 Tax=Methylocella silvestris TaxID=199596 RepID=A0A2J7TJ80_METSI|nr:hypothetical protein [Methylocella silvestris]PNG26830.1 hypothetical protein CR492_05760 [Methylocella silvestris]
MAARQLPLDLALEPGFSAEDFFISGSNESAYQMIERWPDWPNPALILIGPPGSGKSHLGAIWAARSGATTIAAASLVGREAAALAAAGALLIEDIEAIGPGQAQLFHLVNLGISRRLPLVMTARRPPGPESFDLPDLLSRLRLAPSVSIGAPDDALMRMVLVKLLMDRQLVVDVRLVDYAALRLDYSLEAARSFIERLDREALARKSRVTRQIAAEVLGAMASGEDDEAAAGDANA